MGFKDNLLSLFSSKSTGFYPLKTEYISEMIGFDFGKETKTTQKLIDNSYGSNVTAYAIIKDIATSAADIPKILVDINKPDEIIESGEVFDMLQNPAFHQGEQISQYNYFEVLLTYLLTTGNTYQRGRKATGFGDKWQAVEIYPSGYTAPVAGDSYLSPISKFEFSDKSKNYYIPVEEILHTKYCNPTSNGLDSLKGLSPIEAALYSLTGSNDIQKAISIMVKNQGVRGILSNESERSLKPEEAKQLSDIANEKLRGVKNFNKVHVANTKMNYLQMGMNATDLKVIESGILTDRQLCNAYGVSSRLYNDPANSTFNNMKEANKSFYTKAVIPNLNKVLADINNNWLSQFNEGKVKYSLQLDTSGIEALQTDQKEEADKDKTVLEGVTSILNMNTSVEGKILLLIETYGYSEEMAKVLAQPNTITNV